MTAVNWDRDAERALLGAAFLRPESVVGVDITPEDLFDPRNRRIWSTILSLTANNEPVDVVTIASKLGDKLDAVGGYSYLSDLAVSVPTADNVPFYAREIKRHSLTRKILLEVGGALGTGLIGEELLARVVEVTSRLADKVTNSVDTTSLTADLAIQEAERDDADRDGITTGILDLDRILGGIQRGVVTILGGRPSMGKSSLARTIADSASLTGHGVHVFSLEDTRRPYVRRVLADRAGVDLSRLRKISSLDSYDRAALNMAVDRLRKRKRNWAIDDTPALSSGQIGMRIRQHRRELGTELVVVDYVGLMREKGARDTRDEIGRAARGMQAIARREDVAVLLLTQLNRDSEKEKRLPMLSDLKETSVLEEIADAVLFVHRGKEEGDQILVRKNKHGEIGAVKVYFHAPTATYKPLTTRTP